MRIPISSSLRLKVRSSDWRRWRHGSNGVEQTTQTSKTGHDESNTNCGGAWRLAWTQRQTSQCISGQTEFFVSLEVPNFEHIGSDNWERCAYHPKDAAGSGQAGRRSQAPRDVQGGEGNSVRLQSPQTQNSQTEPSTNCDHPAWLEDLCSKKEQNCLRKGELAHTYVCLP